MYELHDIVCRLHAIENPLVYDQPSTKAGLDAVRAQLRATRIQLDQAVRADRKRALEDAKGDKGDEGGTEGKEACEAPKHCARRAGRPSLVPPGPTWSGQCASYPERGL